MILRSFTKKGYWCGRKYLVFKSYGSKVQGTLQNPALEDSEGYIVHFCSTITICPQEQLQIILAQFKLTPLGQVPFRVFTEEGVPYEIL